MAIELADLAGLKVNYVVDKCFDAFQYNNDQALQMAAIRGAFIELCGRLDGGIPDNLVVAKDAPTLLGSFAEAQTFTAGEATVDLSSCGFSSVPGVQLTAGAGVHNLQVTSVTATQATITGTDAVGDPLQGDFVVHVLAVGAI